MLRRCIGSFSGVLIALLGAGCVAIPAQQYALLPGAEGGIASRTAVCGAAATISSGAEVGAAALDPARIRIASWNLHKQQDAGWRDELKRLADRSDLLLLQEAGLTADLRAALGEAGYTWVLASAFAFDGIDYGVAIAARVRPISFCTGRAFEPLTGIPKSYLVASFVLDRREQTLAVATVHAINFTLDLAAFDAQLRSLGDVLALHRGPVALAGDFNTWSEARTHRVESFALQLMLEPIAFAPDRRSLFFGRPADWMYARGADALDSEAYETKASDHNPLLVTLRIR